MSRLHGQDGGHARAITTGSAATRPGGERDDRAATSSGTAGRTMAARAATGAEGRQAAGVADEHRIRHSVCGSWGGRVFWDQILFGIERSHYRRTAHGGGEGACIH